MEGMQHVVLLSEDSFPLDYNQGRSQGVGPEGSAHPSIEMLFQIFKLNFSWDMSKMNYFSDKFLKIAKRWSRAFSPQRRLIFNIDDLKFRDLAKE